MGDTPKMKILSEETRTVDADSTVSEGDNPYWLDEEQEPHPDPSLGCVRRGLCCRSSPGWFAPGEVEKAAAALDMSPDDFVRKYLVIDSIDVDGQLAEVFVPVKMGRGNKPLAPPATRVDRLYRMLRSPCVFFKDSGCQIYDVRPLECRHYLCTAAEGDNLSHREIGAMWLTERQP